MLNIAYETPNRLVILDGVTKNLLHSFNFDMLRSMFHHDNAEYESVRRGWINHALQWTGASRPIPISNRELSSVI